MNKSEKNGLEIGLEIINQLSKTRWSDFKTNIDYS